MLELVTAPPVPTDSLAVLAQIGTILAGLSGVAVVAGAVIWIRRWWSSRKPFRLQSMTYRPGWTHSPAMVTLNFMNDGRDITAVHAVADVFGLQGVEFPKTGRLPIPKYGVFSLTLPARMVPNDGNRRNFPSGDDAYFDLEPLSLELRWKGGSQKPKLDLSAQRAVPMTGDTGGPPIPNPGPIDSWWGKLPAELQDRLKQLAHEPNPRLTEDDTRDLAHRGIQLLEGIHQHDGEDVVTIDLYESQWEWIRTSTSN